MESVKEDLRSVRRRQTHDVIARAAVQLALERGAAAVTVDAIAAAAGVSRRTFFNYFPSKENALIQGPPEPSDEEVERFVTDTGLSWLEALRLLLIDHASLIEGRRSEVLDSHRLLRANPELLAPLHARFAEFEESLADVVRRRGEVTGVAVDASLVAAVCTGLLRVAADRWLADSEAPPPGRLTELVGEAVGSLRDLFSA